MIKKLLFSFFIFTSTFVFAQNYGNEWINYGQKYYQFKVAEDGIYRINYATLVNAGIPIASINPKNFQLFGRGKEIAIFISGESDNQFDATDYIEFYAQKNDGWLDSVLYKGAKNQANPYYSLIGDTASYFLSWNSSTNNKRLLEETDVNFAAYTPVESITVEKKLVFKNNYFDGETFLQKSTDPTYSPTEGWMSSAINNTSSNGQNLNFNINSEKAYPNANAQVHFRIGGQSDFAAVNNGDHHLQISFANQLIDTIFEGYALIDLKKSFSTNLLSNLNTAINIKQIDDRGAASDRTAISFAKLRYQHLADAEGKNYFEFEIADNLAAAKSYFKFINFSASANNYIIDISNQKRILVSRQATEYSSLIPNGGGMKKCILYAENAIKNVVDLKAAGENGLFKNYLATLPDSAYLMISHPSLDNEVLNYFNYRQAKGYYPFVVNINELYNQYAFGIVQHPLAIRNFIDEIINKKSAKPEYLYLMGKSIRAKFVRNKNSLYLQNLVPTMGNPASDNLFTAGLGNTNVEVAIPTGRISARNNQELKEYLDKVKEYEAASPAAWMKSALHFVGGTDLLESQTFESYMTQYKNTIEDIQFGGNVKTFKKTTSAPIQTTLADSIQTLINNGTSLMTFFGHAANAGGFDINIDEPQNFKNFGKYPVILGNACYTGDVHQEGNLSTSEDFVLIANKAAIAFIATVDLSYPAPLNEFSSQFYRQFSNLNYGKSMAYCMQQAVKNVQSANMPPEVKSVLLEMSLQGDPALVINSFPKADYTISKSSVSFNPKDITTDLDSFVVNVAIQNIGRAVSDSLGVEIIRRFPNGRDTSYLFRIESVKFQSNISLKLPIDLIQGVGENTFIVTLDPLDEIDEMNELNNQVSVLLTIRSGDLIPIYPYNFAVVPNQGVTLKASTAFAFEKEKSYVFELDTNGSFNSTFKKSITLFSAGGVLEWSPNVLQNMPDSTVYFWRVSKTPDANGKYNWKNFSFQYIPNKTGWGQDHFDQFETNSFQFIEPDFNLRRFDFTDNISQLSCVTIGNPFKNGNILPVLDNIKFNIDNITIERNGCTVNPAFMVVILDSLSFQPWQTPYNGLNANRNYGQLNLNGSCRPRSEKYFIFQSNSASQMTAMKNLLLNTVADGNYILIYNWFNIKYSALNASDPSILQTFYSLGANTIPTLSDSIPFIFGVKKGDPSSVREIIGDSINDEISLKMNLVASSDFGQINSRIVGPTTSWDTIVWRTKSLELNSKDSASLSAYAFKGAEVNAQKKVNRIASSQDRYPINSIIDANSFPLMRLEMEANDTALQTPPQLDLWHVYYQPVPEAALNPLNFYTINKDTLDEGETLKVSVAIDNISAYHMDSLLIHYKVLNAQNKIIDLVYPRQGPLLADSTLISEISIPTLGLAGNNKLLIDVNPDQDQIEQFHFNNLGQINFFVEKDNINPVMDVTFDGRRILNGELITPEPEIVIQLSDENKYLALNDTSDFAVYLLEPGNQIERKIHFGQGLNGETMEFYPGNTTNNNAKIIYKPKMFVDGTYQLRAQANDKTGNLSASSDYLISFKIETKASITNLMNYPNPFTTSTRFVFTLSGVKVPDYMQIQIMTITGKIVKTIDMNDLGNIHIGQNITDYAWDGTDDFGDRLANGVYLYRVRTNLNGQSIDHRESAADQYFKEGFGKMYLMK